MTRRRGRRELQDPGTSARSIGTWQSSGPEGPQNEYRGRQRICVPNGAGRALGKCAGLMSVYPVLIAPQGWFRRGESESRRGGSVQLAGEMPEVCWASATECVRENR